MNMRLIWRTLDRGVLRDSALICLAMSVVGISYGAVAVSSGLPVWLPVVLAVVVLAGSAELLFAGIVAAGGSPIAAVVAGLVINARHVPYGLALPDVLGSGRRRLVGAHVINDESVAMTFAQKDPALRKQAYWVTGIGVLVFWPLGALTGAVLGAILGDTDVLGLDAVFPALLTALAVPALRSRARWAAVAAGVAIALATTPFLPAGVPVLLALLGVAPTLLRTGRRQ